MSENPCLIPPANVRIPRPWGRPSLSMNVISSESISSVSGVTFTILPLLFGQKEVGPWARVCHQPAISGQGCLRLDVTACYTSAWCSEGSVSKKWSKWSLSWATILTVNHCALGDTTHECVYKVQKCLQDLSETLVKLLK